MQINMLDCSYNSAVYYINIARMLLALSSKQAPNEHTALAAAYLCCQQRSLCLLNCCVKPKAFVDEQDVVVDGLGHTNNIAQHVVLFTHLRWQHRHSV
jgi:hypothetical protein